LVTGGRGATTPCGLGGLLALLVAVSAPSIAPAGEGTCDGAIEIVSVTPNGFCSNDPTRPMYSYPQVAIRCSDGEVPVGLIPAEQFKLCSGGWEQPVNCSNPPSPFEGQGAVAVTCGAKCDPKPAPSALACLDPNAAESPRAKVGDPVDLATGFVGYSATDVDLGRGLAFTRLYSSGLLNHHDQSVETAMGVGWR
jgi:hypothetical protein